MLAGRLKIAWKCCGDLPNTKQRGRNTDMAERQLIGLELHDASLWEPARVLPVIDVMERWGYNTLVLHQNDLLDACTQLGLTANYGVSDLRLKKVRNNTAWLNRLVDRLALFDARLFLEIKEPSFHDYALELYPDLLGPDGRPDPTKPAWGSFVSDKVQDLLRRIPGLGGIVATVSSPESRVSLPDFQAANGVSLDRAAWFDHMIAALASPLLAAGKDLFIRDFSYTKDLQSDVLAAVDRQNGRVGSSVKVTAHDYFPEYPENPAARSAPKPLILEFEGFGEHTGWGVIPNCRVGEFCDRMAGYREMGASGFLMRISWEAITGAHALDGLSGANVYALPLLAQEDQSPRHLVCGWLVDAFGLSGDLAHEVADLLLQSWEIPAAAYWQGRVFPRHSCLPSTWQEGWLSMHSDGMGRRDRALSIHPDDPLLTETAREALFRRKTEACDLATQLATRADQFCPRLPERLAGMFDGFAWLPVFARQFELATQATFFAARNGAEDGARVNALREDMLDFADDLERRLADAGGILHHQTILFDPEQVRAFARSLDVGNQGGDQ